VEPHVEGATRLAVPPTNLDRPSRAPGERRKGEPFYNPGMGLNRDLSVLLLEAFARSRGREVDAADALSGTGARAARWAVEVQAPVLVHANDADPHACAAQRATREANGIEPGRMALHEGDAHAFLAARRFDLVDLDPCGSPMPFLDAGVRATRHAGLVCATATDTAALAGAVPRACRRRYDAHHGLHAAPWRAEVGLRILAGAIVRSAARFERVATPVLSVAHGHWMRVVARVEDGRRDADRGLRRLAQAWMEGPALPRIGPPPAQAPWAGPLWAGPLHEAGLVAAMRASASGRPLARPPETVALLELLAQECEAPPFWIVPDRLQRELGPPPRRDALIARLAASGHAAARTHLDPQGVRTDAGLDALRACWGG
jgi:tRNA (guanine26-N2/guanine27-N2)-dimethyltransferase